MINMSKLNEHENAYADMSSDARVLYQKILDLSHHLEKANIRDIVDLQKMARFQSGPCVMYSILMDALEYAPK